jgi:enamine deaminase RidA (YjgF/YER057c/UK114 family)
MARHLVVEGLFPPPDYAHAVVVDPPEPLVFAAGGVPLDRDGNLVGEGDPVAQTEQVLANLAEALRAVGSGLDRVVKTTVYVVAADGADLVRVWDVVRASGLAAGPHASTLLGVSVLGYTGQLVEIEAVAVIPGPQPP